MRPVFTLLTVSALTFAGVAPASAQATAAITVTPDHARLGESFTVSGTSDCPSVAYTVTFTYTNHDLDNETATATGTTDASGEFTQAMTVPQAATAGEPAEVVATVACAAGDQTTNVVPFTVDVYEGTLTIAPAEGEPGDEVTVSGTACAGGDIVVIFTDGEVDPYEVAVTLNPDGTFAGTFQVPDEPGGDYFFAASCPGTDFEDQAFALINEAAPTEEPTPPGPGPAPVPTPQPGAVDFTG